MSNSEQEYFRLRAVEERAIARASCDLVIAAIHDEMADQYFVRSNLSDEELAKLVIEDRWIRASADDADNFRRSRRS